MPPGAQKGCATSKEEMITLDDACKKIVEEVNGAKVCAVVDLDSGFLLGVHDNGELGPETHESLAAATVELFRGVSIMQVEQAMLEKNQDSKVTEHQFEQVQLTSRNHYYFSLVLKGERTALILVTEKTLNVGMGWAQLRAAVPEIEGLIL